MPSIIAGPMLRHVDEKVITIWLVTKDDTPIHAQLFDENDAAIGIDEKKTEVLSLCLGKHCFIRLVRMVPSQTLSLNAQYAYNMNLEDDQGKLTSLNQLLPDIFYEYEKNLSFALKKDLTNVVHGSCRKAHFSKGSDALPQLDKLLKKCDQGTTPEDYPDLLLLTGDQVYVDDVAGPMLHAINQVIDLLGLHHESFTDSIIEHSSELADHKFSFYDREKLFPEVDENDDLTKAFFKGARKPVFTSVNAHNHLIALNEVIALYLLSWSSRLWPLVKETKQGLNETLTAQYNAEAKSIELFCSSLDAVERALAHVPTYMIFDDHDVTDDWNLTRGWEEQVYGNAFSKRMVGNALCGYFLCQGLGNPYTAMKPLVKKAQAVFTHDGLNKQDAFIDTLLEFDKWHYQLNTSPPVHVLDTRTQRWRSESNKNKPSGLMDWEGLCELQQNIIGKKSVIMVSAAPVYGVKFIETIQRVFTAFGGALIVDAENWMAHRGTASVMLNIFRHIKTPPLFIILSGDVHYSFVYDISLRFRRNSPKILQFTCSGMHNEFPDKLLTWFERLNRWLYGHRSPLNWLTKRRNMSVKQRKPQGSERDVINACSIGVLQLEQDGTEKACKVIRADGSQVVFKPSA
ncbi:alkaline phosphatase family protein [Glaciecola sp. XM2]|nr:alkaline phosphatase family protein [Glaciecola sp. XM2]